MHCCLLQVDPGTTMFKIQEVRPLVFQGTEENPCHTARSRLGRSEDNASKHNTAVTTKTVLGPWSFGYCAVSGHV